ncbi:MAG: HD-GYP domain-containing protein [Candidatus Binatia bacterium]
MAMQSHTELQQQVIELQHQLDHANAQLSLYASDLRRVWSREREKAQALHAANLQLEAFAKDLKIAYEAEKRKSRELEHAHYESLLRLTRAMRYKDDESAAHIERISHYSQLIALHLGLSEQEAYLISAAAPMHDVGKIGVPDEILLKKGPLTPDEWEVMKKHAGLGASLLKGTPSPLLEMAGQIALTHHERWDGSGYPQGIQREDIPLVGRIVMLADQYDALRSARPYKAAFSHEQTCEIILNGDGRTLPHHFDPQLLDAFRDLREELRMIYGHLCD